MITVRKREYNRKKKKEWRLKNPEKNKEQRKKYQKSAKGIAANKKYKNTEPVREKTRIYSRKRYAESLGQGKEYIKIYMRKYLDTPEKQKKYLKRQEDCKRFMKGQIEKSECDQCASKENLEIHHLDYEEEDNFIILCRKHHRKLHRIQLNQEVK